MTPLYISKSGSRSALQIPNDAVTRTFGIFGVKDSGKTTTARVLAEQIVKVGGHVVILDPVGVWWGITRAGDGPGLPGIVIGGEHGDVPLEETGGQLVAELAVGRHWPVVVVDMKLLRKGASQRFMADFLETVYFTNRRPLMMIFEEADRALPQSPRGMDPTLGRVLGAAEDIVKLGRSRGLGSLFLSQRIATVTKNVTEQVECLVLHAQPGPRDRKAVKEWVESNGDPRITDRVMQSMASLDVGEAWLYSPKWLKVLDRIRVKMPKTLDSSSTPTDDERDAEEAAPRANVDLDVLRREMAETVERQKANDPKVLRARIEELEAGDDGYREAIERIVHEWGEPMPARTNVADVVLEMKRRADTPQHVIVPDREAVVELSQALAASDALLDELLRAGAEFEQKGAGVADRLGDIATRIEESKAAAGELYERVAALPTNGRPVDPPAAPARPRTTPRARSDVQEKNEGHAPAGGGDVSKPALKLLKEMRELYPLKLSRIQLATILRRGKKSSTLTQQLAELAAAGLIENDRGTYSVPDTGGPALTLSELKAKWRAALPDGPAALLEVLLDPRNDRGLTREGLFEAAGFSPTSSTPVTHLKLLTDNGLAEKVRGGVQLGAALR